MLNCSEYVGWRNMVGIRVVTLSNIMQVTNVTFAFHWKSSKLRLRKLPHFFFFFSFQEIDDRNRSDLRQDLASGNSLTAEQPAKAEVNQDSPQAAAAVDNHSVMSFFKTLVSHCFPLGLKAMDQNECLKKKKPCGCAQLNVMCSVMNTEE